MNTGSCYSVVGGGFNNAIGAFSTTGLGFNHSFIGGGCNNTIESNCSSIVGGGGNTVSGYFSSVLGGSGNTVTHNWSAAVGCNVVSNQDCAFHSNILVSQNTPIWGSSPPGTLEYFVPTPALIAAGIPLTACIVLVH